MFRLEISMKGLDREDIISSLEEVASDFDLMRLNAFTPTGDNLVIMYHGQGTMLSVLFLPAPTDPCVRVDLRSGAADLRSRLEQTLSERFGDRLYTREELEDKDDE